VDLVLELDGREVIRKASAAVDFADASAKYVVAIAMSKPFDGENCRSRLGNAKAANAKADGMGFGDCGLCREWRPEKGSGGVLFGSADCVPAYMRCGPDRSMSIWR
jgi:hypothetical protein